MPEKMLYAYFGGKQVVLDEPYGLKPDTRLIITVLSEKKVSDEQETWLHFSRKGLENAYGKDEPEYTLDMMGRINLSYKKKPAIRKFNSNSRDRIECRTYII